MTLHPFAEEIMQAAREATGDYLAKLRGENQSFKAIHDDWDAFRKLSSKWLATAELNYGNFAYGV